MNRFTLVPVCTVLLLSSAQAQQTSRSTLEPVPFHYSRFASVANTFEGTLPISVTETEVPTKLKQLREQIALAHKLLERAGFSQAQIMEFSSMITTRPPELQTLSKKTRPESSLDAVKEPASILPSISRKQTMAEAELQKAIHNLRMQVHQLDETVVAALLLTPDGPSTELDSGMESLTLNFQSSETQAERLTFLDRTIPQQFVFTTTINPEFIRLRTLHEELVEMNNQLSAPMSHLRKQLGILRYQKVSANRDLAILASAATAGQDDIGATEQLLKQRTKLGDFLASIDEKITSVEASISSTKSTPVMSWSLRTFAEETVEPVSATEATVRMSK